MKRKLQKGENCETGKLKKSDRYKTKTMYKKTGVGDKCENKTNTKRRTEKNTCGMKRLM